jgi:uncharacterized protein YjaZ
MDRTWTLHWLQAAGSLAPWRARIRAEIDAAFDACAAVLPPPRVDIVIHQIKHWPVSELGFGGSAPSRNTMFLGFDTANPAMEARLAGGLRRVVVHEALHCLRQAGPGYGATLGETLVSEGLADHFVIEALGGQPDPWCVALDEDDLRAAAALTEPALGDDSATIQSWFVAGGRRMVPWAGYSLAWRVTEAYLALTAGARPSQLVRVPAERVLATGWPAVRRRAPEGMDAD